MYKVNYSNRFKKDLVKCYKRGMDIDLIEKVVELLQISGTLPQQYKTHPLKGKHIGKMECHIQNNWLLVWKQNNNELTLLFTNTGTHSDLF